MKGANNSCVHSVCVCVYLVEADVLCSGQVEAVCVTLVLQQCVCEAVGELDVAAVVGVCMCCGVVEQRHSLLNFNRVQHRHVSVHPLPLRETGETETGERERGERYYSADP